MQKKQDNIKKIIFILKKRYPKIETGLNHKNGFELLIATILSAQCTDRQVNQVTKTLFKLYPTAESLSKASIKDIEKNIYSTGFYKNKASNIKKCAYSIFKEYNNQIPNGINDLTKLAGVGRKTANVVLSTLYNIPAMVVDTHVTRVSQRLNLTKNQDAEKIEKDLMNKIPIEEWNGFSLRIIFFGREICIARNPKCEICNLSKFCAFFKTRKESLVKNEKHI